MSPSFSPGAAVMDVAFGANSFEEFNLEVPGAHVRLRPHTEENRVYVRGSVPDVDPDVARDIFDRRGISTHQLSDRLHVYGDPHSSNAEDWRWRRTHREAVHLDVRLPPDLDVTAQTPGGTVDVSNLSGTVDLTVMGGSAFTEGLTGSLHVRGSGGTLTVREIHGPPLDLQWSAGEVTLQQIESDATTLQVSAAYTTLQDVHGPTDLSVHGSSLELRDVDGPCEARVQGGELIYRGSPTHDTSLTAVGGSLQTHLPVTQAAELRLIGSRVALDDAFAFNGEQTNRRIEGTLNGGGPHLRLRTVRGIALCRPK